MIIPDINLLMHAHNDRDPQHAEAKEWWEGLLNGRSPVGLPWIVAAGFIRLMTNPRVLELPMEVGHAVQCVRGWLEQEPLRILHPGERFDDWLLDSLSDLGTAGNLTTDAQLALLAVEYQAELHSNDADFHRFPGLRWRNPLG